MPMKIIAQKDFLLTEVTIDASASPQEIHDLMRQMKANGRVVTIFNGGTVPAIQIEQKTHLTEERAKKVRAMLHIRDREL